MRRCSWGFAGLAATTLVVHLGLFHFSAPEGPMLGFPVHHDDFRNLSYRSLDDLPSLAVRPVSTVALGALSVAGHRAYYAALHGLVALYVSLVVWFVMRLFPAKGWTGLLLAPAAIVGALAFEHVPEYALYSGLITNLVSAVTALGALLLLDREAGSRIRDVLSRVAGIALLAASLLAKEDFAAAVFLALALRTLERGRNVSQGRRRGDWLVLAALAVVGAAFLVWSFGHGRTSFLRSSAEAYRPDFSPSILARTAVSYLTCSPGAWLATGVQAGTLIAVAVLGYWRPLARGLGIVAVTLALVAPYAALPRHFYPYYAFNWTVWQAASVLALGPILASAARGRRLVLGAALLLTIAAWVATTQGRRSGIIRWYGGEASRNRAIMRGLAGLRETLRPWRTVGVTGVSPLNPWFGHDGYYFRSRLGLPNRWVVFADPQYLERTRSLLGVLRLGSIEVAPLADLPRARFPLLALAADGSPHFTLLESVVPEPFDPGRATLVARPGLVRVCDGTGLGVTTLEWDSPTPAEVRVDSPDGPVFAGLTASGRASTGKWVHDGTTFFLRERSGRVAAVLALRVTTDGCP